MGNVQGDPCDGACMRRTYLQGQCLVIRDWVIIAVIVPMALLVLSFEVSYFIARYDGFIVMREYLTSIPIESLYVTLAVVLVFEMLKYRLTAIAFVGVLVALGGRIWWTVCAPGMDITLGCDSVYVLTSQYLEMGGRATFFGYFWILHFLVGSDKKPWGVGAPWWRSGLNMFSWILLGIFGMGTLAMYTMYHVARHQFILDINEFYVAIPGMGLFALLMILCLIDAIQTGCGKGKAGGTFLSLLLMVCFAAAEVGEILWALYSPNQTKPSYTTSQFGIWMIFTGISLAILSWSLSYFYTTATATPSEASTKAERERFNMDTVTINGTDE